MKAETKDLIWVNVISAVGATVLLLVVIGIWKVLGG